MKIHANKTLIFFESENGFVIFQYLLERIARKTIFIADIPKNLFDFLTTIIKHSPNLAKDCARSLVINPILWRSLSITDQCEGVGKFMEMTSLNTELFSYTELVDLFMETIEVYIGLDPVKYKKIIEVLWNRIWYYIIEKPSYEILKKVMEYANLYYIKRLANYPLLILMSLKLLLTMHLSHAKKLREMIRDEFKKRKDERVLSAVLIILVYFLHQVECCYSADTRNKLKRNINSLREIMIDGHKLKGDLTFFEYYDSQRNIIEQIIAICIYFILDFDWNHLYESIKSELPRSTTVTMSFDDNLDIFLFSQLEDIKKDKELNILNAVLVQRNTTNFLSLTVFKALTSILLNTQQDFLKEINLPFNSVQNSKPFKTKLLNFILIQAPRNFTTEVNEYLINLLAENEILLAKIKECKDSYKLLLNLSQCIQSKKLSKMQANVLFYLLSSNNSRIWKYIRGDQAYKLRVMNDWLDLFIPKLLSISQTHLYDDLTYLKVIQFLEDILQFNLDATASQLLIEIVIKLLLFFDKLGFIDGIVTMETQKVSAESKAGKKPKHRGKGKILQVMLKACFVCVKERKSLNAYELLNYLLFGTLESKSNIVKLAEGIQEEEIIPNYIQDIRIVKNDSMYDEMLSESNLFENKPLFITYVFFILMQLIYFELFGIKEITQFAQLLKEGKTVVNLLNTYRSYGPTKNYFYLVKLLRAFVISSDIENDFIDMIIKNINKLAAYLSKGQIQNKDYKALSEDQYNELECKEAKKKSKDKAYTITQESSDTYIFEIVKLFKSDLDIETISINALEIILCTKSLFAIYPIMQLIVTNLCKNEINQQIMHNNTLKPLDMLISRTWSQVTSVKISTKKIQRDEYRANFKLIAKTFYKKVSKEQYSELGCWYTKINEKFVKRQRDKFLKRRSCESLENEKKVFDEFVALSLDRDKLGRAMKLKRMSDTNHYKLYDYLRVFTLKKMLIRTLLNQKEDTKGFYSTDFKFEIVRSLFKNTTVLSKGETKALHEILSKSTAMSESTIIKDERSLFSGWCSINNCIPSNSKIFHAEMITIKGAIFGRLILNSNKLVFCSTKRIEESKLQSESIPQNQLNNIKVFKCWKLEEMEEIIIKRYNLIRQAIEIYFNSARSVFFSLYSKEQCNMFLTLFKAILKKKPELKLNVIVNPEKHFNEKKFAEQWAEGNYTNYDYLMLLNKYGGRSFNDLNQYPIFPWIIRDYKSDELKLNDTKIYRNLETPISAISIEKRKKADERLNNLMSIKVRKYLFKEHYLPYEAVPNYLARLYPYASLISDLKETERILYNIRMYWKSCLEFANTELIPEFYYLPEMFCNYNSYLLDTKSKNYRFKYAVNDVVLPPWCPNNNHVFVQNNAMALESSYTSSKLEKWIDLVFGYDQQDANKYNSFDPYCDEVDIIRHRTELTDLRKKKNQRLGVNPIRLFKEKHPSKVEKQIRKQNISEIGKNYPNILIKLAIHKNDFSIIFIDLIDNEIVFIKSLQKVYFSKGKLFTSMNEVNESVKFKSMTLPPFKPFFKDLGDNNKNGDSQRCFSLLRNKSLLVCKYYDYSWKYIKLLKNTPYQNYHYHNAMVNCICSDESNTCLFTASHDGMLSMWQVKAENSIHPKWFACNHNSKIFSIDTCEVLGLVATAGLDGNIVLRRNHDGKFIRLIRPLLYFNNLPYKMSHIRLSYRGYLVIIAKSKTRINRIRDYLLVYSINGERIQCKETVDVINGIVMGETGYEFIIGRRLGRIFRYNLLTLNEENLLDNIDKSQFETEETFNKLEQKEITSMNLVLHNGSQFLLLGTRLGELYILKIN